MKTLQRPAIRMPAVRLPALRMPNVRTRRGRVVLIAGAAALAVVVAVTLVVVLRGSGGVPYKDARSVGLISLFDRAGKPLTGGKVTDRPFAWRAVSSQKAPAPYAREGRKATLVAFQPRRNVDPAGWD